MNQSKQMKRLFYIWSLILIVPLVAKAQSQDKMQEAYSLYNQGMYLKASEIIDEVVESKKGKNDRVAWHIRGFIYKDIYINIDKGDRDSEAREIAIESLKRSYQLDESGKLEVQNRKALRYLGVSYFNDASEIIEEREEYKIDKANDKYLAYKDVILFLYSDTSLVSKDVEFYLAMSTAFRKLYEEDRENREQYWDKSNEYLIKVLEIDPANWAANYSLAVSHYNQGAYKLQKLPSVNDIMDLYEVQSESIRSIEMALPFMLDAYEINPEKIETIRGLKWIYFNLHREEDSQKMDNELKQMEGQN